MRFSLLFKEVMGARRCTTRRRRWHGIGRETARVGNHEGGMGGLDEKATWVVVIENEVNYTSSIRVSGTDQMQRNLAAGLGRYQRVSFAWRWSCRLQEHQSWLGIGMFRLKGAGISQNHRVHIFRHSHRADITWSQ